jgi:hypothetical protein
VTLYRHQTHAALVECSLIGGDIAAQDESLKLQVENIRSTGSRNWCRCELRTVTPTSSWQKIKSRLHKVGMMDAE